MARYLSSNTLIESAARRATLPETQVTFLEKDFLAFANEEMDMAVIPYVMQFHEDYFLFKENTPLLANTTRYTIPYRAVGNKLRDVQYLDNGGNIYEMTRTGVGDASYFQYGSAGSIISRLRAFLLESDEIVLQPEVTGAVSGESLNIYYYLRPNQLVSENRVMIVTSISDIANGNIGVDKLPVDSESGASLFSAGTLVDFIKVKSPHKCLAIDAPVISVNTTTKILSFSPDTVPANLKVGDHVALAEECMIPQIPTDLHSMLAQRIAARCLEAMGDTQGLQAANAKLAEMELKGGTLIDSRVEDAPLKVTNRHGLLRNTRRFVGR